jgi:hypothetical protein
MKYAKRFGVRQPSGAVPEGENILFRPARARVLPDSNGNVMDLCAFI